MQKINPDIKTVKMMAEQGLRGDLHEDSPFVFMDWDASRAGELEKQVREHLSLDHVVVVRGLQSIGRRYDREGLRWITGSLTTPRRYISEFGTIIVGVVAEYGPLFPQVPMYGGTARKMGQGETPSA